MVVGFDSAKMMGLSLIAAISAITSGEKAPGDADTPINTLGRTARTLSNKVCYNKQNIKHISGGGAKMKQNHTRTRRDNSMHTTETRAISSAS